MLFKLLTTYTKMISIPNKVPRKKRFFLGPLSRKILKLSNWEITGEFPNYKKIILIGVPHTANRDAWYALLAVLALDLKINFFDKNSFIGHFNWVGKSNEFGHPNIYIKLNLK